jgi:hypothetical protein
MKKVLLFAILALSINAFGQNKQPMLNLQHQPSKSMEDVQGTISNERMNKSHSPEGMPSELNPKSHHGQSLQHQTLEPLELIQIYDSIYIWDWDTLNIGWKNEYKYIDFVYGADNKPTSYT